MLLRLRRDERGFTMVTVIGVLLVITLLSIAALSYAQGDLPDGAHDRDRKVAYAAAEAGVQNYVYYLAQDPTYWSKCDNDTSAYTTPKQINQRLPAGAPDTRQFVPVPNTTNRFYTIELLPANGKATCDVTDAEGSMIDSATGTFRIRVTGRVGSNGLKRSIIVNFKRQSLLDYIYFTDKETLSPLMAPVYSGSRPTRTPSGCTSNCRTLQKWAMDECDRYYGDQPEGDGIDSGDDGSRDGHRQTQDFNGQYQATASSGWSSFDPGGGNDDCTAISFATDDVVAGPFHTNDEFACSGTPTFGLSAADSIRTASLGQTADPSPGYRGCTPDFVGTHNPPTGKNADKVSIPATNGALYRDTAANNRFVGRTQITFNGANMTVTGTRENGTVLTNASVPIPADGVVYVSNSKPGKPSGSPGYPCAGYDAVAPYANQTSATNGCGNLEVKGAYSASVTLTAENDIIIMDSITRPAGTPPSPDVLAGLISNNFIRVYHPATCTTGWGCNLIDPCSNAAGSLGNITIDAAILSLNHSFLVDNFMCGAHLGTLTVRGAIVQKFRGPVGYSANNAGYTKNYSYDTRLRYRSPPKFLDPVKAAWRIQTQNEQVPAR